MWVFLQKFIFLYLMIIWYFTCKNWWNKSILIPIGMLLYQTINLLNDEVRFKDEGLDAIVVIPLVFGIVAALALMRNKLNFRIIGLDLKEKIDLEIKKLEEEINA